MSKKLTIAELNRRKQERIVKQQIAFLLKSSEKHCNKYDYSKVEYINSRTKVCIICPEHGEFWQTPLTHLKGCGCPKCAHEEHSNRMKGRGLKYTKEVCFKISKQCSSRSEFQKLNQQAYHVSRINGWLDEMTHFETHCVKKY